MQFVLIFLAICLALFLCTLGNGLGALCMLALALTLVVCCVITLFDRLAGIDRKLEQLLEVLSAQSSDKKEERNENA